MTIASTKTANRARLNALVGLVAKLDEYIAVLGDELNDTATIAVFHGWKSTRFEQGKKMRREIAALRRTANAEHHPRAVASRGGCSCSLSKSKGDGHAD